MSLRIMNTADNTITSGTITGVVEDVPTISGTSLIADSDITCAKRDEGSTTVLATSASRPSNTTFRGLYVMECTVAKAGYDIIVVPPDGGGEEGNSVLVETTGACAEIAYAALPQPVTVRDDGEFNYTTTAPTDPCTAGRRTNEQVPTQVSVTFTVGLLDTRLTGNGNRKIKTEAKAPGQQTYNLGMDSPHHEYFSGACDMCFGSVKVEWLTAQGVKVHTQRYAGFTPPTYLATVPASLTLTAKAPTPVVFRTVQATDLYTFTASSTTKDVPLLSGLIECGTVNVSAYLYATDLARITDECRKSLSTQYNVFCPTGSAKNAGTDQVPGTVDAEGETFNILWDASVLDQYAATPTASYTQTVEVPFTSFGQRQVVTWSDGYSAIVQNSLSLDALNLDGTTETSAADSITLYRAECDLQEQTVSRKVVFKSLKEYSLGPQVQMLPTMRFQKYSIQNATVGMTATGVQFCPDDTDGADACVTTRRDGDDWIYMPAFTGCNGAASTDIGGMVTFSDTSNTTYLASQIKCSGSSRVEIADLYLNWELTFVASAFDATNEITKAGSASTLAGFTAAPGVAMHTADLCSGDGSVTLPSAPWDPAVCGQYLSASSFADLESRFATCGIDNTIFITQYVTFTNANSGEVMKFCNTKKLTYTTGSQEGVVTASFAVASRSGYSAAVSLTNFEWETCETDNYRQVMTLAMTHNYDGTGALSLDMTTNDILQYDTSASDLDTGLIRFKSACTDICVDQSQLDQTATTHFTIGMGGGTYTSDFQVKSRIQGNPCEVTDELAAIPDMQLRIEKPNSAGACTAYSGLSGLVEESVFDSNDRACFHLSLAAGQSKNANAKLNVQNWAIVAADGVERNFVVNASSLREDDWYAHNEYMVTTLDYGATIHVHVYFRQDHSARRRLRASFLLGSKDTGEQDVTFTVLPAHTTVEDQVDGDVADEASEDHHEQNDIIPADDEMGDNVFATIIIIIVVSVIVVVGVWFMCKIRKHKVILSGKPGVGSGNFKYTPVGRFDSKLKY